MYVRNEIPLRAAGISFFTFFSLFPIVTTFVSLLAVLPTGHTETEKAFQFMTQWLLPNAVRGMEEHFKALTDHAAILSVAGVAVTIFVLIKITYFFEGTVNRIWNLEPTRNTVRVLRKALLMCVFLMVVVTIGITVSGFGVGDVIVEVVSTWMFFLYFNKWIPDRPVAWREALPGAVLGGAVWYVTKWGFTLYVQLFAKLDQIYAISGYCLCFSCGYKPVSSSY